MFAFTSVESVIVGSFTYICIIYKYKFLKIISIRNDCGVKNDSSNIKIQK